MDRRPILGCRRCSGVLIEGRVDWPFIQFILGRFPALAVPDVVRPLGRRFVPAITGMLLQYRIRCCLRQHLSQPLQLTLWGSGQLGGLVSDHGPFTQNSI